MVRKKLVLVQCAQCDLFAEKKEPNIVLKEHWERTHQSALGAYQTPRDVESDAESPNPTPALTEEVSEGSPASRHQTQGGGGADTAAPR